MAGDEGKTWRAYLSTSTTDTCDRIGTGPWYNADGELIAEAVDALHSEDNNISKQTALSQQGEEIAGRGDDPNRHDILTGSNSSYGMAFQLIRLALVQVTPFGQADLPT